ncbi:GGDEF domain-containing protein [Rhodococcus sp. IEGM 1381]|uniref:GGDEF domain-containing protein n=1 Tax=Rhodococcus sp. IEGM 1381 TaxID=3047085 RepID=UPI0024B7CC7A|nr:GGDEF domain-containing protein [Rhodococcus sp. IEGM 1381]
MRLIHQWWSFPADYAWSVAYHRNSSLLSHNHIAVGIWCWFLAGMCISAIHTPAGFSSSSAETFGHAVAAAMAVTGAAWVRGPFPSEQVSRLFVLCLEFIGAGILLMLADPFVALPSAAALGIVGSYIAAFHGPKLFLAHQAWALLVAGILLARAVTAPSADVVLAWGYFSTLALVLFSVPMLTQALLLLLRSDAANAFYDPLTGLRNRRGLAAAVAERESKPLSGTAGAAVLVVDLDGFKLVNDRYGHELGDQVLRTTAEAILETFPPPAITARTGGEEFAIVSYVDLHTAIEQVTRLQTRLAGCPEPQVTMSVGVAHLAVGTRWLDFERAWNRADSAMYAAKRAGGNGVHYDSQQHTETGDVTGVDE